MYKIKPIIFIRTAFTVYLIHIFIVISIERILTLSHSDEDVDDPSSCSASAAVACKAWVNCSFRFCFECRAFFFVCGSSPSCFLRKPFPLHSLGLWRQCFPPHFPPVSGWQYHQVLPFHSRDFRKSVLFGLLSNQLGFSVFPPEVVPFGVPFFLSFLTSDCSAIIFSSCLSGAFQRPFCNKK